MIEASARLQFVRCVSVKDGQGYPNNIVFCLQPEEYFIFIEKSNSVAKNETVSQKNPTEKGLA